VAMSRAAILELAELWSDLTYVDDDGQTRTGIFCEFIREDCWYRDDYAFFSRVPEHVRVEALLTGVTEHAGYRLRLDQVPELETIPLPPGYSRRDTQPPRPPVGRDPLGSPLVDDEPPTIIL
jgi:hypothetical protein